MDHLVGNSGQGRHKPSENAWDLTQSCVLVTRWSSQAWGTCPQDNITIGVTSSFMDTHRAYYLSARYIRKHDCHGSCPPETEVLGWSLARCKSILRQTEKYSFFQTMYKGSEQDVVTDTTGKGVAGT